MQSLAPETIADGILGTALGAWADEDSDRAPTGLIYVGPPPADEPDLLFVSLLGLDVRDFASRASREGAVAPHLRFVVTLFRDFPAVNRDVERMRHAEDDATRLLMRDGALLHHAIAGAWGDGDLIAGYPERAQDIRWGEMTVVPPGGTVTGWSWEIRVDATARLAG